MDVSCRGSIIWKKESDKFKTFAGIIFQNLNKIAEDNIMNMLSLNGDMFPDTFFRRNTQDLQLRKQMTLMHIKKNRNLNRPIKLKDSYIPERLKIVMKMVISAEQIFIIQI